MFRHIQESSAPSCIMVIWENKHHHSEHIIPFSLFLQLLRLSIMSYGLEHPFGQLRSDVPAISPLNILCTPFNSLMGQHKKQKVTQQLLKHQYITNTLFFTTPNDSTIWRKLMLSQPKPVCSLTKNHILPPCTFSKNNLEKISASLKKKEG